MIEKTKQEYNQIKNKELLNSEELIDFLYNTGPRMLEADDREKLMNHIFALLEKEYNDIKDDPNLTEKQLEDLLENWPNCGGIWKTVWGTWNS